MGSYTKHQGNPRNQLEQCNKWMEACPSGVTARDLSSIQTRHNHCGTLLTTKQQANRCQQSHLMPLWSNGEVIWDTWDPLWQNVDLQKTCGKNSTEVQEMSISPDGYGCKGYWTTPPLSTVSNYGVQCHWLWTKPHNYGTIDKSAKAGQSAERGNASYTGNPQGTHPLRPWSLC